MKSFKTKSKLNNSINVIECNGQLVVDSRLVAQKLDIKHKIFLVTIEKYQAEIKQDFGTVALEARQFQTNQGNSSTEKFYYLNED